MDDITKTTELEAINEMLNAIGEGAVSAIDTGNADVATCVALLRRHTRAMQARGWWFNSEKDYPLTPDGNNELPVPANTLKVDTSGDSWDVDVTLRGTKLYDRTNHTFTFTAGTTYYVDLVVGLVWDELPQTARDFIVASAGLEFCDTDIGSEARHAFTEKRRDQAFLRLITEDMESEDPNMLLDSFTGRDLLDRRI